MNGTRVPHMPPFLHIRLDPVYTYTRPEECNKTMFVFVSDGALVSPRRVTAGPLGLFPKGGAFFVFMPMISLSWPLARCLSSLRRTRRRRVPRAIIDTVFLQELFQIGAAVPEQLSVGLVVLRQ